MVITRSRGTDGRALMRWAAWSAALAGLLWLAVWLHQRHTHGVTSVNEAALALGLTWMDSAKFLTLSFGLLIPGFAFLTQRGGEMGSRTALFSGLAPIVGAASLAVTAALEFGTFAWGSYAETFESTDAAALFGGLFQALSSLVLTIALLAFAAAQPRARLVPLWLPLMLAAGVVTTTFLTPVFLLPALAWLVFAGWLWFKARQRDSEDLPARPE